MANPRLPGISETEETLLYAKLNEYNRGRISFKKAGAYLIVLPRSGHSNYSITNGQYHVLFLKALPAYCGL